jgi:hypothetical protein
LEVLGGRAGIVAMVTVAIVGHFVLLRLTDA